MTYFSGIVSNTKVNKAQQEDKNDVTKLRWHQSLFVSTKGSISAKMLIAK